MLTVQDTSYIHPNGDLLFAHINLTINKNDKIALIGNNGTGKSTLLKILAGELQSTSGLVKTTSTSYYVPQLFGQFNDYSIAQALQADNKIQSLYEILNGGATEENMTVLDDDWTIEERCHDALQYWDLKNLDLNQKMGSLSGGQKTKVFLAGILIHRPEVVLLDEPTNHLDAEGRNALYEFIRSVESTIIMVSHDRTLLNIPSQIYELRKEGITIYGGNYEFYTAQKHLETEALTQNLRNKEKALRKAKETEREALARQQKLDARGKRKQEKAGLPTISMNTFKNRAENSSARMKDVHAEKVAAISKDLSLLRKNLPDNGKMKIGFDESELHHGKVLLNARDINFGYDGQLLWKQPLSFEIISGKRYTIKGPNGSGKTSLIKMILGRLQPKSGTIAVSPANSLYIDQDYSLISNQLNVHEQAQEFNSGLLQEHEIKIRLNRFLFSNSDWDKPCNSLSGGEKMRLMLCCLTISNQTPDMIILDEPTNNLDIQNIEILTSAINEYEGTLIVVSHDEYFLKQIYVEHTIILQ